MKKILIITVFTFLLFQNCTKVDEKVYDKYDADLFYATPVGADAALNSVYALIPGNWNGVGYAGADRGWYDINSMSTDEQVVPHRNTGDWELDFAWLYMREWLPSNAFFANTWNWLYKSIFTANLAVGQLEHANAAPSKIAEAKVLRAFFYYLLIDDFGNVPFYTDNTLTVDKIPQADRKVIYDFVVKEITDNIDNLTTLKGGANYGRFNKYAAYALLAKVYLNAEVYTGTPQWAECNAACDQVIAGGYILHTGALNANAPLGSKYYELFGDVCPDDETILAIYTKAEIVGRNIFTVRSLGGNDCNLLFGFTGWNGSVIPKDFLEKFDTLDVRYRQFRFGSHPYGPTPPGFFVYTLDITSLETPGAGKDEGARSLKFLPVPPMSGNGASNDFPIYRYADILLMKAECLVRLNQDPATAESLVTQVRVRAGLADLGHTPTLDEIYNERGFELTWEGHRRQDMIRFGKFTAAHGIVPAVDAHFNLFPIPTSALNANHSLIQNPGY
jgi:starch-binding outer membrane protein, SusD/RagB family